jgi:periplasmic copper chaperone A
MQRRIAFAAVLAGAILSATGAFAHEASNNGVTVVHPWVRATPGGSTITAAYMEIKTAAGVTDRLLSASTPAAGRVELHTHEMDGDVMRMRRVDSLEVADGQSRVLKPSGDHVMLFDVAEPLKEGDLVALKLEFEKAGTIEIEATVEPVGAMGPHGMDHQPGHDGAKPSGGDHHHHH